MTLKTRSQNVLDMDPQKVIRNLTEAMVSSVELYLNHESLGQRFAIEIGEQTQREKGKKTKREK